MIIVPLASSSNSRSLFYIIFKKGIFLFLARFVYKYKEII
jgi:hypothetical protein